MYQVSGLEAGWRQRAGNQSPILSPKPLTIPVHQIIWFGYSPLRMGAGLPFWYTPSHSPFLLQANAKSLRCASSAIAADVQRSGGRVALNIPPHQPAQNLQLLAFFGHRLLLLPSQQAWLQSGLAAGLNGLSQLFPSAPYPQLAPWPIIPNPLVSQAAGDLNRINPLAVVQSQLQPFSQQQWQQQEQQLLVSPSPTRFQPGGILRGGAANMAASGAGGWAAGGPAMGFPTQQGLSPPTAVTNAGSPRAVWMAWEETEGGLGSGCSLFDDQDSELIREMTAQTVLSDPVRAHALSTGFFKSAPAVVFALQRLYAWGAICAMYGPQEHSAGADTPRPVSTYVQVGCPSDPAAHLFTPRGTSGNRLMHP